MFKGAYTAIVTPFGRDGGVDYERLRELLERQIAAGIDGVVPVGTTGESPTLDVAEHEKVIATTVDVCRGRIPVIMQEHLIQMGKWLSANREAIYGTRAGREPVQWSEGNRDFKPPAGRYVGGGFILKQTVDPDPGYAVKELFFTRKEGTLYAISPRWPGKEIVIKGLRGQHKTTVTLLGTGEGLKWKQRGKDFGIQLPEFRPEKYPTEQQYAYAFRISPVEER